MNLPRPLKKYGQNFLLDEKILDLEVKEANISKKDIVLEIGAGPGGLTKKLGEKAKEVYAFEPDQRLIPILEEKFKVSKTVKIIPEKFEYSQIPKKIKFTRCVSNIPYFLSSTVIDFLARNKIPAVLILQKEFARRLVAEPEEKTYSRITILAQFYTTPIFLKEIPKDKFSPSPKVDSAIVKLIPKKTIPKVNEEKFFFFIENLFSHSKSTVAKALKNSRKRLETDTNIIAQLPHKNRRVRSLGQKELIDLFERWQNAL